MGLQETLIAYGVTDKKLIRQLDKEWRNLDALNPQGELANVVVICGRDLGKLTKYLSSTFHLQQRGVGVVALAFANKASAQLNRDRQLKLGIKLGRWRTCGAGAMPCDHWTLDKKYFFMRKGMKIDGRRLLPGEDVGCTCSWAPVIPGFVDDHSPEKLMDKMKRLLGLNQN